VSAASYTEHVCDRCGKRSRSERNEQVPTYWSTVTDENTYRPKRTRHFCEPCFAAITEAIEADMKTDRGDATNKER
jgi:hypothetical protein